DDAGPGGIQEVDVDVVRRPRPARRSERRVPLQGDAELGARRDRESLEVRRGSRGGEVVGRAAGEPRDRQPGSRWECILREEGAPELTLFGCESRPGPPPAEK